MSATTSRRHPGVQRYLDERAEDVQARLADAIMAFAGSMPFVCLHAVAFAAWNSSSRPTPTSPGGSRS